jgi:hypothetical protein
VVLRKSTGERPLSRTAEIRQEQRLACREGSDVLVAKATTQGGGHAGDKGADKE